MCSPTWKLSETRPSGFTWSFIKWAWMIKLLATADWLNLQPFSLPRGQRGGVESSNPLITLSVLLASSPVLRCGPKLTSGHLYLSSLTKFRGFWELWARNCKDQIYWRNILVIWNDQVHLCLATQSCPTLCDPMCCSLPGSSVHGDSLGRNTGVGSHALLQGIFPTQGCRIADGFFTIWATRKAQEYWSG